MEDLEVYQDLKRNNHPSKMLAIAEHWLRKELEENRARGKFERAQLAAMEVDPTKRQGGYASGTLGRDLNTESNPVVKRQGRLSDIMGNSGTMAKNRKTAA